jgi:hypothetical protein
MNKNIKDKMNEKNNNEETNGINWHTMEIDPSKCVDKKNIKNDISSTFKLANGTKFCSYKKKGAAGAVNNYPLILEQDITFSSCKGLKVMFMGQSFSISEVTETEYKFNFDKGTLYTLESDQIGLIKSLNHNQDFAVQNATKIEVPVGTVLVSTNRELDISVTLNHRMILDIIS